MLEKYKFILLLLIFSPACQNERDDIKIIHSCDGGDDTLFIERKYSASNHLMEVREFNHRDSTGSISKFFGNGNIEEVRSVLKGKVFGDNEIYYSGGSLKKYHFLIDSLRATFIIEYDETGRCIERSGTPLVFKLIGTNRANDTLEVKFVFADKIFSSISSEISSDGIHYLPIEFENCDSDFPLNKVYTHTRDISKSEKTVFFLKTTAFDRYEKRELSFYDTLNLVKKKH